MSLERTYKCWRCWDLGYQTLRSYRRGMWLASSRPCSCGAAPVFNRSDVALEPSEAWIRGDFGDFARAEDLLRFGAPNAGFTKWMKAHKQPQSDQQEVAAA
jgi:hypothetical protein